MYIYIYIERERERDVHTHVYVKPCSRGRAHNVFGRSEFARSRQSSVGNPGDRGTNYGTNHGTNYGTDYGTN